MPCKKTVALSHYVLTSSTQAVICDERCYIRHRYLDGVVQGKITLITEECMSTDGAGAQIHTRRRSLAVSSLAVRILIAFIVSWIIVLAFFISGAISH